jgi:electron transfer flavoprotein alpha subunit
MGVDRAVHLLGHEFAGADTLATARALAASIRGIEFDVIFCGKYSTDAETAQVPPMLAELLGLPQVTGVTGLEWADGEFTVTREMDEGFETWRVQPPLLMSAAERLAKPLRVIPEDLERVREMPIERVAPSDLGDISHFGAQGSPTRVESIEFIEPPRKKVLRDAADGVDKIVSETLDDLTREGLFGEWQEQFHRTIHPGALRSNPAKSYWVFTELVSNEIRPVSFELLGRAVQLARTSGGEVAALLVGADVARHYAALSAHGADKVYAASGTWLGEYLTEPFAEIVSNAIREYPPFAVLFPSTANGRDLAPRVAARMNLGLTGDILDIYLDAQGQLVQLKPAFGGNVVAPILTKTTPVMATVRPGMLDPATPDPARSAPIISLDVHEPLSRVRFVSRERTTDEGVHLDNAEIVIGVGMGIGGPENLPLVEELCRTLDAHIGATRRVVDQGWLPRQLQIGLTGRSISPHLYIALGVRGAFNHTVGIQRAGTILAINNDPNAAIFAGCDYGIIGDWLPITKALVRGARARRPSPE